MQTSRLDHQASLLLCRHRTRSQSNWRVAISPILHRRGTSSSDWKRLWQSSINLADAVWTTFLHGRAVLPVSMCISNWHYVLGTEDFESLPRWLCTTVDGTKMRLRLVHRGWSRLTTWVGILNSGCPPPGPSLEVAEPGRPVRNISKICLTLP